jgi:NADPH:quinone reductase-like Zn-dependent oxidoreductase
LYEYLTDLSRPKMAATNSSDVPSTMKAWTYSRAGAPASVLFLSSDIPTPVLKTSTAVLVRVEYVSIHVGSVILMHLVPFLFRKKPTIAETDFSGVIVAGGPDAPPELRPGTQVVGSVAIQEHMSKGSGALAEFVAVEPDRVVALPQGSLPLDAVSTLPVSGTTALPLVRAAQLQKGQKVLFNAPCGGVGNFAVQMVRNEVGTEGVIVGICSSANLEAAKRNGCDAAIAYDVEGDALSKRVMEVLSATSRGTSDTSEIQFDVVIDAHGSQALWNSCEGLLKPSGAYISVGPKWASFSTWDMVAALFKQISIRFQPTWLGGVDRRHIIVMGDFNHDNMKELLGMMENQTMKPVIRGTWAMDDALNAYESVRLGHGNGKVVLKVG